MANAKQVDKEKQQMMVLIAILVLAALYCVYEYGYAPLQEEKSSVEKEIGKLEKKIKKYKIMKSTAAQLLSEFKVNKETVAKLKGKMVPANNPIIWAPNFLKKVADKVGISAKNRSITCDGVNPTDKQEMADSYLLPYHLTINIKCEYHRFGKFLEELENQYPFLSYEDISISRTTKKNLFTKSDDSDYNGELDITLSIALLQMNPEKINEIQEGMAL